MWLGVPADFVDDDAALPALEYVGEEAVGEFVAEVAEVEGLLLRPIPLVLRGFELVAHYFVLQADLGQRLGLQHQEAGHYCDQQCHDYRQGEQHAFYNQCYSNNLEGWSSTTASTYRLNSP
jgi:hypothetical protein